MGRLTRFWRRLTSPFVPQVHIHDRTRIVVRQFPFRLEITPCQSVVDIIRTWQPGDSPLVLESAIYYMSEPLVMKDGQDIRGE